MPKLLSKQERVIQAIFAVRDELENLTHWRRTATGNLTRRWDDCSLTIFRRQGKFYWVINRVGDEARFSPTPFDKEHEALEALGEELTSP